MKNLIPVSLLLGVFTVLCGNTLLAQNVGINEPNPQVRMHVNGGLATSPASAPAANTITVPDNVSAFVITAVGGAQNNNVNGPNNPVEGQRLSILNLDSRGSFEGFDLYGNGQASNFIYLNGAWRKEDVNPENLILYSPGYNLNNNTVLEWTLNHPAITTASYAQVAVIGDWGGFLDDGITIHHVETINGAIRAVIENTTGFNLLGFDVVIFVVNNP